MSEQDDRRTVAHAVVDLVQTGLTALETAEMLADPDEARRMVTAAEQALVDIARIVRQFAGTLGRSEQGE